MDNQKKSNKRKTTAEFVKEAQTKFAAYHYDYSQANYTNNKTKVTIVCAHHGPFEMAPDKHLSGQKCKKCTDVPDKLYNTKETFLARAREIHGDRYDYSKILEMKEFPNVETHLPIICPEHGPFMCTAIKHIRNKTRCSGCAGNRRKTLEQVLAECKQVHGDRYDYSLVTKYERMSDHVTVICPKDGHGPFSVTLGKHVYYCSGCPECAFQAQRGTLAAFLEKARAIHGTLYDYSHLRDSDYKGVDHKIKIRCKEHGLFDQTPYKHITCKHGCATCGGKVRKTTEQFIAESKAIHGDDRYDYSLVQYVNGKTPVKLICREPNHGEFEIRPIHHLIQEHGCPICGGSKRKTLQETIDQFRAVHGDKYDYSEIKEYVNSKTKVPVICREKNHGTFWVLPSAHKRNSGCPVCKFSRMSQHMTNLLAQLGIKVTYEANLSGTMLRSDQQIMLNDKDVRIEFDGAQHFRPVSWFTKEPNKIEQNFEQQQERDSKKSKWHIENKISCLRISYAVPLQDYPNWFDVFAQECKTRSFVMMFVGKPGDYVDAVSLNPKAQFLCPKEHGLYKFIDKSNQEMEPDEDADTGSDGDSGYDDSDNSSGRYSDHDDNDDNDNESNSGDNDKNSKDSL